MAGLVRRGMDLQMFFDLAEMLGISSAKLAGLLSISKSTLARRGVNHDLLKQDESERVLRFMRLLAHAISVFKTREAAVEWFSTEIRALGDKTPMNFVLIAVDFDESLVTDVDRPLPADCRESPAAASTAALGDAWIASER